MLHIDQLMRERVAFTLVLTRQISFMLKTGSVSDPRARLERLLTILSTTTFTLKSPIVLPFLVSMEVHHFWKDRRRAV